ncbi:30S ribosome-binding factor RbfA [bacterium]|nr:30S ribosome-binding factor RbfA [bacterium]
MVSYRLEKMNEALKTTIAQIIVKSVKDPRIGFVTVTHVNVARDLKSARVYISQIGSEQDKNRSLEALQHAASFIQHEAGQQLRLRYTPKMSFILDHNPDYAQKITTLLEQIHQHESE